MAGAQVPLGILAAVPESASLSDVVETFVAERFFEAFDAAAPPAGPPSEFPVD